PPADLTVFDASHPRPNDANPVDRLRQLMTEESDKRIAALQPKDARGLESYRGIVGAALRVMIHDTLPGKSEIEFKYVGEKGEKEGLSWRKFLIGRKGLDEKIGAPGIRGPKFDGTVVVWVHPEGQSSLMRDGKLVPAAQQLIDRKAAILAPDVTWTGEARGLVLRVRADSEKLKAR